jgi:hypothetical protein
VIDIAEDVRVLQGIEGIGLALKPQGGLGAQLAQDLHGGRRAGAAIQRGVDDPHAALAGAREEVEPTGNALRRLHAISMPHRRAIQSAFCE